MQDLSAKRTLVKSPPELWEELSEVQRLAKHLGAFGEIKITKLDPEHTVAWEGEHASGTVSIEPSGWGTKVTLTAELAEGGGPAEAGTDHATDVAEPAATSEEAAVDVAQPATITERDGAPAQAEPRHPWPAYPEPVVPQPADPQPIDEAHPPLAETPPAAALAFDAAGAPAIHTEGEARSDARTNRPRKRRGFWARLFAAWLVPEERLSSPAVEPVDDTPAGAAVEPAQETPSEVPVEPTAATPAVAAVEPSDAAVEEDVMAASVVPAAPLEGGTAPEAERLPVATPAPVLAGTSDEDPPEESAAPAPSSPLDPEGARAVLEETLDALGSAHHRPYSRS